jgi:hypothetical protein
MYNDIKPEEFMSENNEIVPLPVYDNLPEAEIVSKATKIDPAAASKEVLTWLNDNVQEYVDNQRKTYRLYVTVADSTGMPNISDLQALYLAIESPEDSEDKEGIAREGRCLDVLDDITEKVYDIMASDKEGLQTLYNSLIYYYEMIGFSSKSGPVLQEFSGYVDMKLFLYEPISIDVIVSEGSQSVDAQGNPCVLSESEREVIRKETIPEGFGIEFVIKAWPKAESTMY